MASKKEKPLAVATPRAQKLSAESSHGLVR